MPQLSELPRRAPQFYSTTQPKLTFDLSPTEAFWGETHNKASKGPQRVSGNGTIDRPMLAVGEPGKRSSNVRDAVLNGDRSNVSHGM